MREPSGAGGSTGDSVGEGARSRGGAVGSMCRGEVRVLEAGSGGDGYSSPSDAGGWQTSGARTVQIGGCQTTVVEEAGAGVRAGIFKERALEVTFEEWVLEGTFEERALEDQRPPPCTAVPDVSSAPPQPRRDGGLGSGPGVDLARSSPGEMVRGDPFLARVHSTKAAKSSRGPSSDDSALLAVFRLAS